MEKQLYCGLTLPLEEIALRRVTVNLWNESILDPSQEFQHNCNVIEDMVKNKVSKLVLPEPCKKRIMHLVKPIGLDISDWIFFHKHDHLDMNILKHVRRTWSGAIDYQKTAEELVRLEMYDVAYRFHIACLFCLEDKIPFLWEKCSEKNDYDNHEIYNESFSKCFKGDKNIVLYWLAIVTKQEHLIPPKDYQRLFRISALKGNKPATEYFFKKLPIEQRDVLLGVTHFVILERITKLHTTCYDFADKKLSEVLCYLLSLLSPEQQMDVFKTCPSDILTCFLDWPLQDFFMDISDRYCSFHPECSYGVILDVMRKSTIMSSYYFPNLFQNVFLRSPGNFRKRFVDRECWDGSFFTKLFFAQDTETVTVIFRNIDAEDRVRLVLSMPVLKLIDDFLSRDEWTVPEVCIREANLSIEDRGRLKAAFMKFVRRSWAGMRAKCRTRMRRRFFDFLNASLAVKRSPRRRSPK